jgi:AraC family transcriptional regulator of arabinose operon
MSPSTAAERRLFVALIERSLAFELFACDLTPVRSPITTGWRTLPTLVVAHVANGADLLEFDDRPPIVMERDQALCVRAGIRHRFTVLNTEPAVSRWAHLQYTVFSSLDLMAVLEPPLTLAGAAAVRVGDCAAELVAAREEQGLRGMSRRTAAAYALLDTIISACPQPRLSLESLREVQRVAPALETIEQRIDDPSLGLPELARAISLSVSRCHELFKHALGLSPTAYLRRRRMARAESLLLGTDLKVREIAQRCGWQDEFHFSRLFKKHHGASPLSYRQQVKETVI